MITVSSPTDPRSFAEFECLLDAEIYHEVAKESGHELVMTTDKPLCSNCKLDCTRRRFITPQN